MDKQWQQQLLQQGAIFQHARVVHYGNLQDELRATLQQPILTDLSYKGLLAVSGPDAEKFLQGQVTCDLRQIDDTHTSLAAHCNAKGRIISAFRIFRYQDSYMLKMPAIITAATFAQLQKYAVFSKVTIQQKPDDLIRVGFSGPGSDLLLRKLFNTIPLSDNHMTQEDNVIIIKISGPWPRFFLFAPWERMQLLWQQLKQHARCCGADAWQLLNIINGIPTIYPATIGKFTPHQINFPKLGAVSFNKGCYVGQEVIARMEHLGKLKSHMYRAQVNTQDIPKPGYTVYADVNGEKTEVGTVVIAKMDPAGGYQLLAVLKDEFATDDVCYINDEVNQRLHFLPLPYATG